MIFMAYDKTAQIILFHDLEVPLQLLYVVTVTVSKMLLLGSEHRFLCGTETESFTAV
jgi:hypothetical protein